jgi:tetratricopeptide (TPR) repeat protein
VKNLRRVARIYQEMGQLQDALDMQSRVFKVLDKEYGEKNTDTIETLYTCGWLNYKLGNYDQALKQLKKSYENAKDVYGDTDQRTTDQLGIIRLVEAAAKRHKK